MNAREVLARLIAEARVRDDFRTDMPVELLDVDFRAADAILAAGYTPSATQDGGAKSECLPVSLRTDTLGGPSSDANKKSSPHLVDKFSTSMFPLRSSLRDIDAAVDELEDGASFQDAIDRKAIRLVVKTLRAALEAVGAHRA